MRGALFILLLSGLFAFLTAWLHPRAPEFQGSRLSEGGISLSLALAIYPDALWLDARGHSAWTLDRIPGALPISEDTWDADLFGVLEYWTPDRVLIVYCEGIGCASSKTIALRLKRELQAENVYYLQGGWDAWLAR